MNRLALAALCACAAVRPARDEVSILAEAQRDLAAGRAEAAQRGFEEVLARDPGALTAIRGRIEAAHRRGALRVVLRTSEEAVTARPDDALGWYSLGLASFADGDDGKAVAALRRAVELRSGEADFHYRLGIALLERSRFAEARPALARAHELAPKEARYRPPLAACLGRLGDVSGALAVLRDFADLQPTAEEASAAVKVGRTLTDPFRGVPAESRAELEQALAFLGRDSPGLAVPPLEALVEKLPDLAPAHAVLGLAVARLDDTGRAVTELRRAAELAPDLPQPHAWLGELYAAKDKPELASEEFVAALERNPVDRDTLRRLGTLRLEKKLPFALETLARAAALAPEDDGVQVLLARAEADSGKRAPARLRLERLAERRPDDPDVLLRLAFLLLDERSRADPLERGRLTRRVENLATKVLSLQPQNAAANQLLAALQAG